MLMNDFFLFRFWRELKDLKIASDYRSCDPTKLTDWLCQVGEDLSQYSYQMLRSGVDMKLLRHVKEDHLKDDCVIRNGVHRLKMLESIKNSCKGRGQWFSTTFFYTFLIGAEEDRLSYKP